ncbi:hypothetical protein K501DRAFT_255623 [Backusella circina FSU 941]|nr:hypothetical protein K501DRAFT_255623 [Backusella circina FSU 941]
MNQRTQQSIYEREQGKIQKPDVYGVRKRKIKKVLQRLNQHDDHVDEFDEITANVDSDAVAAAKFLIQNLPSTMPPVCLLHQIYNILPNNTIVDKEIQNAVKEGTWRKIHVIGQLEDEILLIQNTDYCKMIHEAMANGDENSKQVLGVFVYIVKKYKTMINNNSNIIDIFEAIIIDPQYNQTAIKKDVLIKANISEKQITYLISQGFLLPHTQLNTYWFSIRKQGQFMSNIITGRNEIIRILKKRSTKDILLNLLKCKKLHKTAFNHEFLLHDLIGSGRVEKFSSLGDLIRLTNKGKRLAS